MTTRWKVMLIVAAALAIVVGAAGLGLHALGIGPGTAGTPQPAQLARLFPDAPESYGVLPPDAMLKPLRVDFEGPPAFSWVHTVEPGSFKFVATRNGRRFYAADCVEALLIPSRDFVGYKTAEDARADGKVPAP